MDKTKTSKKQKASSKNIRSLTRTMDVKNKTLTLKKGLKLKEYNPIKNLLDKDKIGAAIFECLLSDDTEGALEVIDNYFYTVKNTQFLKEEDIKSEVVFHLNLKSNNPTIKTFAKILHETTKYINA